MEDIQNDLEQLTKKAQSIINVLYPLTEDGKIYKELFSEIADKVEQNYNDTSKQKMLNTNFSKNLKKQKTDIENFLEKSSSKIHEIKAIETKIKGILQKIENKQESVERLYIEANSSKKEVTKIKNDVNNLFEKIKKINNSGKLLLSEIKDFEKGSQKFYNKCFDIHGLAERNIESIKKLNEEGKESLKSIKENSEIIDGYKDISEKKHNSILKYFSDLFDKSGKNIENEIDNILTKIKSHQSEIDKQLNFASANRLVNAYKIEKDNIEEKLKKWNKIIARLTFILPLLTIFLITAPIIIHAVYPNIKIVLAYWQYASIVTPIVVYLGFSILEHARLKRILDEYVFKYVSAFGLPAYFELIDQRDPVKATEYLIETTKEIYANPNSKINAEAKDHIIDYLTEIPKIIKASNKEIIDSITKNKKED